MWSVPVLEPMSITPTLPSRGCGSIKYNWVCDTWLGNLAPLSWCYPIVLPSAACTPIETPLVTIQILGDPYGSLLATARTVPLFLSPA